MRGERGEGGGNEVQICDMGIQKKHLLLRDNEAFPPSLIIKLKQGNKNKNVLNYVTQNIELHAYRQNDSMFVWD